MNLNDLLPIGSVVASVGAAIGGFFAARGANRNQSRGIDATMIAAATDMIEPLQKRINVLEEEQLKTKRRLALLEKYIRENGLPLPQGYLEG